MIFRVPRLDVEEDEVDALQVLVGRAVAEETGGVERGVQVEFLGCGEEAPREGRLLVAVLAAQRAAGAEERDADARSVKSGGWRSSGSAAP